MWLKVPSGLTICILSVALSALGFVGAIEQNCKVVEGEFEYDLSELASKDYWHVFETLHTEHTREYFLSICHPLRNVPNSCPGKSLGVCEVTISDDASKPTRLFKNAGQVPIDFKVTEYGRIEYIFENGERCTKTGRNVNHTTEVHLMCPPGTSDDTGPVLMSSPGCETYFAWMTKAACPKKITMSNVTTCTVKFSNSDHVLNLHTLHSLSYYNVSSSDANYELNICGPVTNGHCGKENATICEVKSGFDPVILGTTENMELNWKADILSLIYKYNSKVVEVQFFCERTASSPQIYFVSKNETNILFSVKTPAVCTPEDPQCVISDMKGNIYDLRPLHKETGNWKVLDTREGHQTVYHINMCGEVNDEHFNHCPPGPIGACQTGIGAESAYNMGFLTSHPTVNPDGSITVLYTGGDVCHNGEHARSTRINLICDSKQREPVLMEVTDNCEYIINWLTPAACPRHVTTGSDCQVRDPLYGNLFDLTTLRMNHSDYNVSDGVHTYLINVCGALVSKCGGEEMGTSSVCQIKGSEKASGGIASSNITFNDGTLVMKFQNGSGGCEGNNTRSSVIIFMCDHDTSGYDGPVFIQEDESCTYHFIWRTRLACPPYQVVDCSFISDNGTEYNLGELSSPVMNEEYYAADHSKKYILNVCRSIVHSKGSRCPYEAAACIVDLKNENQSVSIGVVSGGPYFENGKLKLKYTRGETCKANKSLQIETVIEFRCDHDESYPYPQLIAEENCKFIFEWSTSIACPVEYPSGTTTGIGSGEECKVTNPKSNYVFDLNPLMKNNGYNVSNDDNLNMVINVCNNVGKNKCQSINDGACTYSNDEKSVISAGKANANLHFLPGFLFLRYDGGSKCKNGLQRSTLVNFVCGAEGSKEGPILIHDDLDNCTFHINWHTELACERRINCFVDTWERRIDLSPLIRTTGNYETTNPQNPKQKFYLNVCRPLNDITGLLCHPGSSGCLADSSSVSSPLNLGHPTVTPVNAYEDGVHLMYTAGSVCPTNPYMPVTSRIIFLCDKNAGKGNPVFKEVTHDCQYVFNWNTSLVCEDAEDLPDTGPICQIKYEAAKANVDLKPLQRSGGYMVPFGNKTFKVNVCGSACSDDSGVCTSDGDSYGLSKKSELKWDYNKLKLTYYGGSNCLAALSQRKTTAIYFECDMSAGFGTPLADDIMQDIECKAIFKWKTNVTCIEGIYNTGDSSGNLPSKPNQAGDTNNNSGANENTISDSSANSQTSSEKSQYSSVSTVVATILVISGIIFVIILFLFKSHRGQRIMASTRRLFGMNGYNNITRRQAESSTLLGPTSRVFRVDDSDDDLIS